jgi:hypothetical protein
VSWTKISLSLKPKRSQQLSVKHKSKINLKIGSKKGQYEIECHGQEKDTYGTLDITGVGLIIQE